MKWGITVRRPEIIAEITQEDIFYDINTMTYKIFRGSEAYINNKKITECKWCGAPKNTSCCEYCKRE